MCVCVYLYIGVGYVCMYVFVCVLCVDMYIVIESHYHEHNSISSIVFIVM